MSLDDFASYRKSPTEAAWWLREHHGVRYARSGAIEVKSEGAGAGDLSIGLKLGADDAFVQIPRVVVLWVLGLDVLHAKGTLTYTSPLSG
jgi:hypothetical protein